MAKTDASDTKEVVRWYTPARRFPQMIGKTPNGERIWGGPYTLTQFGVGAAVGTLLFQTAWLWGSQNSPLANIMFAAGVTFAAVWIAGKIPLGSRNPLSMAYGSIRALTAPAFGRIDGVPVRERQVPRRPAGAVRVVVSEQVSDRELAEVREPEDVLREEPAQVGLVRVQSNVERLLAEGGRGRRSA